MRTREEILEDTFGANGAPRIERNQLPLVIELLLDIRDQLTRRGEQLGDIRDLLDNPTHHA